MRIISGSNKGKKLIMPNDKTTRPLKDMAKESVFNILHHSNKFKISLKYYPLIVSTTSPVSLFTTSNLSTAYLLR